MMTTIKVLFIALALFMAGFRAQQVKPLLIGKWQVTAIQADYPPSISPADKMKAEMSFADMEKMFKASPFIFEANGDLTVMQKSASWQLARDEKSFRIILMKDEGLNANIISLDAEKLVFVVTDHEIKETFTLKKIR